MLLWNGALRDVLQACKLVRDVLEYGMHALGYLSVL